MRLHPGELWRTRPACFGKPYQGKWRPLDASCPLDPCFKWSTPTCALILREKEHEGSTPSWSHPPQITIHTRRLWPELPHWRENQQKKWQRRGKKTAPEPLSAIRCCAHLQSSSHLRGAAAEKRCGQKRISPSQPGPNAGTVTQRSPLAVYHKPKFISRREDAGQCV